MTHIKLTEDEKKTIVDIFTKYYKDNLHTGIYASDTLYKQIRDLDYKVWCDVQGFWTSSSNEDVI